MDFQSSYKIEARDVKSPRPALTVPWPAIWRHASHSCGRTWRGLLAGFLLQSLTIDSSARAQCADYSHGIHWIGTVEELGSFHENSGHALARSGSFLYAVVVNDGLNEDGYYFSFYVLDLAGNLLGQCSLRGEPRAVSVGGTPVGGGTYAYVAISQRGLQILDVSNPTDPRVVRTIDTPGHAYDVAVAGTHVYVADGSSGVHVVDVTYPPLATLVLTVETPGVARGVTIDGTRLYVADGESGLQVMDASNPGLPRIVGSVDTPGLANDVAVTGSCAYVANGGHDPGQGYAGSFTVVDVSSPTAPVAVPATLPPEFLHVLGFALDGSRLYTVGYSGLTLFDVGVPFEPQFLGRGDRGGYGIAVAGDRAYVGGTGLEIQDVSLPMSTAAIEAIWLDTAVYEANGFFFSGSTMYVADGGDDEEGHTIAGGLRIYDLSTRQSIGRLDLPGAYAVALWGTHAVLLDYDHFYTVDVSNPTMPRLVGDLGIGGYAIAVAGSVAYAAGREGLKVIDLSIPSAPKVVATMDSLLSVGDVEVRGNQLLVLTHSRGLYIFEITHPESPVLVGSVPLPFPWGSFVVSGNTVHVSAGGALTAIDISDPSAPRVLVREAKFSSYRVVANGDMLYILGDGVVEVVDVSNPLAPMGLGRVEIPTWSVPRGLATDGHHVFVGYDEGADIRALPLQCARPTPLVVSDLTALPDARGVVLSWNARGTEFAAFDILRMTTARAQELAFIGAGERNAADGAWRYVDTEVTPGSTYSYSVQGIRRDGSSQSFGPIVARALPRQGITLGSISPSPARDAATIPFSLAERGTIRLEAFDARGRRVRVLLDGECDPGHHVVRWDGLGADGAHVSNGLYFVRLTTPSGSRISRALFIR